MSSNLTPELAQAIRESAGRLGADPVDLATMYSFESGGSFNPSLWGGKNKNYLGISQMGPEERVKYGVTPDQSAQDQVLATEQFLKDRGFKPGMGMADLYSTLNAGSPGRYNASDAANGGTWGTVADKVNYQMAPHRAAVAPAFGSLAPMNAAAGPTQSAASDPSAMAAAPADASGDNSGFMAALAALAKNSQAAGPQTPSLSYFRPDANKLASAIASLRSS